MRQGLVYARRSLDLALSLVATIALNRLNPYHGWTAGVLYTMTLIKSVFQLHLFQIWPALKRTALHVLDIDLRLVAQNLIDLDHALREP